MAKELRIAFVGAGNVNFGGGEGPWDHASRLERIGGVRVVGVADPDVGKARAALASRRGAMYREAQVYGDYREMLERRKPDAVWIGVPPGAHGTAEPGKDMELRCAQAGIHVFVEKPLSAARPEQVRPVAEALRRAKVTVSVGYMFRYSRAVEAMRRILAETPGGLRAFLGRYDCAYSEIGKREWWDVRMSGGPIVEQATHFVDLARYLGGEPEASTPRAVRIRANEPAGRLRDAPPGPDGRAPDADVPDEFRVPRGTAAIWKFANGAIGSLTHGALLHEKKYDTEIELWGDGLRIVWIDPYGRCALRVRRPHSEEVEELEFGDDDPYLTEDEVFLEAVRTGSDAAIRSSYEDAFKTFELTWRLTDAA